MLRLRIASSLVGIPLILLAVWLGGLVFTLLLLAIAMLAGRELGGILKAREQSIWPQVFYPGLVLFFVLPLYLGETGTLLAIVVCAIALVGMALAVEGPGWNRAAVTAFSLLYLGFLLSRLVLVREGPEGFSRDEGFVLALAIIVATWANDIFSYAAGRLFGQTKLAPSISPGKTVEGAVAGLAVAVLALELVLRAFGEPGGLSGVRILILGIGLGLAAQMGDLFESSLKRSAGIKDSGAAIPGHGGFLDRFDSLIFTAAGGYYVATFLQVG